MSVAVFCFLGFRVLSLGLGLRAWGSGKVRAQSSHSLIKPYMRKPSTACPTSPWAVLSRVISPLIWVITTVTHS